MPYIGLWICVWNIATARATLAAHPKVVLANTFPTSALAWNTSMTAAAARCTGRISTLEVLASTNVTVKIWTSTLTATKVPNFGPLLTAYAAAT